MVKSRKALGRGLEALIPARGREGVRELPLEDIVPDRGQPRQRFDEARLSELAESIRLHGILQPLIVASPDANGKHRLIVGERRWQAARLAGLSVVPIVERETSPDTAMAIALVENLQRQDLDPLEEAAAFDRLIRDHGMTQAELAEQVGRSRPSVANSLRLLGLPSSVKDALIDGRITEGHARCLLGLGDSLAMDAALQRILRDELTVRQTETLVTSFKVGATPRPVRPKTKARELQALEDQLRLTLRTKVSIHPGRKASRIVIEYYSAEDLQTLTERLLGASEEQSGSGS